MSYVSDMIDNLECNLMVLREELKQLEYFPEITGTVITKLVRCSRPNCPACASGYYHGPNAYYRYYENGELKDKYLGKKIRDAYIYKTEANKKYEAVEKEIRETEQEIKRLQRIAGGDLQ